MPSPSTSLPIGINIDGVLQHDGLPTPDAATRFAWIRDSGAFDYIEKNHNPEEDLAPYFDLVQEYGVPIGVFGGIFCAGRDEERMRWCVATGGKFGAPVFNMQLFARRADGAAITDEQVADFFMDAMDHGAPVGCLPSLEVHVDMWSEQFARVERVAELLARRNAKLRITLDHSHLVFKMDHPQELALSGLQDLAGVDSRNALPAFYRQWVAEGWVAHAHTRSVAPGIPHNTAMDRQPGQPGRAIQYPFIAPPAGTFHSEWDAQKLEPWKQAVRELLAAMHAQPASTPQRISCEFIPFPDYGGGGRYSIWENNLACAAWLRDEWKKFE
jgi:hypothetical protein